MFPRNQSPQRAIGRPTQSDVPDSVQRNVQELVQAIVPAQDQAPGQKKETAGLLQRKGQDVDQVPATVGILRTDKMISVAVNVIREVVPTGKAPTGDDRATPIAGKMEDDQIAKIAVVQHNRIVVDLVGGKVAGRSRAPAQADRLVARMVHRDEGAKEVAELPPLPSKTASIEP